MNAAVMAATKTRKSAIDALGNIPVKPERPVFAPPPVEPRKPMQNPKGNKNQKNPANPPMQPMQPNKPGGQNNQQPDPNVQSKVNKPAKNQNASGNAEIFESDFSA
jgi:hypothetical protein